MLLHRHVGALLGAALLLSWLTPAYAAEPPRLKVLLLGDKGHHRPAEMARVISPALDKLGIDVTFTDDLDDLNADKLAKFDALAIYRDSGDLPARHEVALLEYVEGGKGLVAIHCASHCFRNSNKYTALVGGRFLKHSTGVFRSRIIDAQHPAMKGVKSFESWDETYIHDQLADDIRVLMVREERGGFEPYTWVRDQGKGRVFYTALGHDERTWKQEGFQKLLAAGTRWAAGQTAGPDKDVKPFEYVEAKVPIYEPGKKWGTQGEPQNRMQKPLDPAESMKHMHLPEGFQIELFAAEPDVVKPIAMAWDERGRLWVAETVDYPNERQPEGKGHDRILILEDTKGTGKADKVTVFADKLSIPTSLVFAEGGVIVAQAPDMLFLKSSKGDDKADIRKVLFTGWGTQDTHAGPSNLRRGPDNWIWGTVGYSGFRGKIGDRNYRFSQGVYRFKPDGSQFEFLGSTNNNTWGLGLGESGDVFGSTANNNHSWHLGLPNRAFENVRGWFGQGVDYIPDHKKIHPITSHVRQVDWHGGFTAAAGHALYTARSFPPEYAGRAAFVCEPTGHLVHTNWLVPQGSAFVARDGWNILASDDEWTAPIMAEVGPDGALWVIDWYNYIVQHNPTPAGFTTGKGAAYETPLRDKKHGRIYRITYTGAKATATPKLDASEPKGLLDALGDDNLFWRQTAQRLLVDRGKTDVLPQLAEKVRDKKSGPAALHALWTMHALGAFDAREGEWLDAARAGLSHPDAGARRAALAVLPRTADSIAAIVKAKCLEDDEPRVRLDALLALSEMPASKEAAAAIAAMLQEPRNYTDRWIPSAAVAAAARNDLAFLEAAAAAKPKAEAEKALAGAVKTVANHLARQAPPDAPGRLLEALASAQPATAEALLAGLAAGWPTQKDPLPLDARAEAALKTLSSKLPSGGVLQLSVLVQRWGQQSKLGELTASVRKGLLARLADEKAPTDDRLAAARDLVSVAGDAEAGSALMEQLTPKAAPALTLGLLEALGQCTSDEVGPALVKRWAELTPSARGAALPLLMRRAAWTRALLTALEDGTIDKADLSIEQAQFLTRYPDKALAERAAKVLAGGGRLPNPDRQKVVDSLIHLAKKSGDKVKGKAIFEKNCATCHRHGSVGNNVGPDLTGVAVRNRADILIDILDPNRSVEGNYRQYNVETKKGVVLMGLLSAETRTAIELLDVQAKKIVILREDIESITATKLSLMPEGFEKIPEEDLVSLLDFLTAFDRYLPLPLNKAATATSVRGMFTNRDNEAERLIFDKWGPQTFNGVPFQVIDPRDGAIPNVILLRGPRGSLTRDLPLTATAPCNAPAKAIHLLSGVSGWGFPYGEKGSVTMIVKIHYKDGKTEEHPLLNGVHFADYIRVVDVPESKLAFKLRNQQIRYLAVTPKRTEVIEKIEFVKGKDDAAPVVMAATIEAP
jgi:putative membrane-bound dehydrogenase-like protein